uniref:Carbonic anhydrase n=2 Tax=Leersia perrieri TaxID=77586 RepID=A0A0D9VGN0_9ORYZ
MSVPDLETVPFRVLKREAEYEIREVESYYVVETTMPGRTGFDFNGSSQSFNVLASYLFGKNMTSEQMEMTTPVFTRKGEPSGEKMDMTTPVITKKSANENKWKMSFVLPSKYGRDLPLPKDPSVTIKEVPAKIVAVAAFSGLVTDDDVSQRESKLRDALQKDSQFLAKDDTVVEIAQYNPPFTLPFTRRNEIALEYMGASVTVEFIILGFLKKNTCYQVKPAVSFAVVFLLSDGVGFGYSESTGPEHWGSLSPNFTMCSKGRYQSPINILKDGVVYNPKLGPLEMDYTAANTTIVDNVFNVALRYNDTAGTVKVDGKKYKLKQLHWHSPSEHIINGQRFAVELHMVHYSDDGNITVIAVLYQYGKPDSFLFQIKDKLAELYAEGCKAEKGDPLPVGLVDMRELKQGADRYFRYVGSLTAPPCTEIVIWNIFTEIREMTKKQAAALMAPLHGSYRNNCRPTQPLNGRTVQLYHV